jgi:hypothetical protein
VAKFSDLVGSLSGIRLGHSLAQAHQFCQTKCRRSYRGHTGHHNTLLPAKPRDPPTKTAGLARTQSLLLRSKYLLRKVERALPGNATTPCIGRVAELEARVEARANPPAPPKFEVGERGPTTTELAMSRASLSREAMRVMVEAVPDSEVAGILRDGRATQNLTPLASDTRPRPAGTGWEAPLSPPPGIGLSD